MCRLLVFRSRTKRSACLLDDLLMRPAHSIIKQSHSCTERTVAGEVPPELNADGFGLAWYYLPEEDEEDEVLGRSRAPALFTSVTPAWSSASLRSICSKVRSGCVFAHVRAASPGSAVTEANVHPFARGQWTFMHNGGVGSWGGAVRRRVVARLSDEALDGVRGSSDSEFCFALFLTELAKVQPLAAPATADVVQGCLLRTVFALEAELAAAGVDPEASPSLLNFAVTDGRTVSATRHVLGSAPAASLYLATGSRWAPLEGGPPGAFRMETADRRRQCAVIASERLTFSMAAPGPAAHAAGAEPCGPASAAAARPSEHAFDAAEWVEIPPCHSVTIGPELNILLVAIPSALSSPGEAASVSAVRPGAGAEWQLAPDLVAAHAAKRPGCPLRPAEGALAAAAIDAAPSGDVPEGADTAVAYAAGVPASPPPTRRDRRGGGATAPAPADAAATVLPSVKLRRHAVGRASATGRGASSAAAEQALVFVGEAPSTLACA
ncbi:hypothetical protein FNF29_03503 [Cafeteria roenbergensis]|uniref:Glutamine amidotransferase type-2 domain-containing protein n=1 Tax=Cafeteria roenbergensis TaxID=33653 RepID=A0A5A8CLJ4_CAFRO|nr:hypothetical protein FNF29_03503 [Cafeteria roenbergensis]|eukprot:KAA0152980.1 hypothetical protein FNF29_03503 [Cafeteria roenbergensis]